MERLSSVTLHPFGKGDLTATGVQYSDVVTGTTTTYEDVEEVTIDVPLEAGRSTEPIVEVELGITWRQSCDGATDNAVGRVQARDSGGTYVTIMTEVTNVAAGVTYEEWTYSGRFETVANLDVVPLDIKVQVRSDGTTNNGRAQVKNSSYVTVIYSNN